MSFITIGTQMVKETACQIRMSVYEQENRSVLMVYSHCARLCEATPKNATLCHPYSQYARRRSCAQQPVNLVYWKSKKTRRSVL